MSELSERLATLSGADRDIHRDISLFLFPNPAGNTIRADWTGDIGAVIAEIERRGWPFTLNTVSDACRSQLGAYHASLWARGKRIGEQKEIGNSYGPTSALALLRALIATVEAERAVTTQQEVQT